MWATFDEVNISLSYHWYTLPNYDLVKICHSISVFNIDICLTYLVKGFGEINSSSISHELLLFKSTFPYLTHWCTLLNIELLKICHSILLFNVDICLWYYVMGLHKVSLVSSKSFFPQEQCINSCFWVKFTKFDLNYLFTQTRKCSQV